MIRRPSNNLALTGVAATFVASLLVASSAVAEVKREGEWPTSDKNVSLDVRGSRSDAVKRIADAAGWSVVTDGVGEGNVELHIKDQPPGRVLDLVLDDGAYVASREGSLVRIRRGAPAAVAPAPVEPAPLATASAAAPPSDAKEAPKPEAKDQNADAKKRAGKSARGEDRTVFGSNVRIEADEVVDDLTVFGGNVEVLGHVSGDVSVFGGNVHLKDHARVDGDASLLGGNLTLDPGVTIGKDVSVLGGNLTRADGASVGGKVKLKSDGDLHFEAGDDARPQSFIGLVGERLVKMAILFVFGTILLALAPGRMESMRLEAAARPMRSFALGALAIAAALPVTVVLFFTIIGIPIWFITALLVFFGGAAGVSAVLSTFGAAVLKHRTDSSYVHLAVGVGALFALGLVPFVGNIVMWIVVALGLGVMFGSRGAGYFAKRNLGPYRSNDAPTAI